MTKEKANQHESRANDHRESGDYEQAGDYFTVAAYERLGEQPPLKFEHTYGQQVSFGEYDLLQAAVCYELTRMSDRSRNRCEQGILIAEDMRERLEERPLPTNEYDRARRGAWDEFIGDFRVVTGTGNADKAYDNARATYGIIEGFDLGFAEQEHMNLIRFYEDVASACGRDLEEWYDRKIDLTFPEWIDHKRNRLPDLINELVASGVWASE